MLDNKLHTKKIKPKFYKTMAATGCPHNREIWPMTTRDRSCLHAYNINEKVKQNGIKWLEKTSYHRKNIQYRPKG
jgi:hypothetical protein